MKFLWLIGYILGFISFTLEFVTENDLNLLDSLEVVKLVGVNLLVLDGLSMWNKKTGETSTQPSLMLPVWYLTFCCCWLWRLGSFLYGLSAIGVQLSCFGAYAVLFLM